MDHKLFDLLEDSQPRMNEKVTRGYDPDDFTKLLELETHNILRCAAESFPPGLKYIEFKRASPMEQMAIASKQSKSSRPNKSRRVVDLARSTTYMIKIFLTYDGLPIPPIYIHIPYILQGNVLYLRGTRYKMYNVISGSVFNIERRSIFIPLPIPRAKLGFYLANTSIVASRMHTNGSMICTRLFNNAVNKSNLVCPVLIYILCEYGLDKTLKFFGIEYLISNEDFSNMDITHYTIYQSKNCHRASNKNKVQIAVDVEKITPLVNDVITSIFYIIDHTLVQIEDFYDELDNPALYLKSLELLIFNKSVATKSQEALMKSHLYTVRMYMDPMLREKLRRHDIVCNTIYDLFKYMITYYQDIMIHHDSGSMYGLEVSVIKYLLYNVTHNIFSLVQNIGKIPVHLLSHKRLADFIPKNVKRERVLSVDGHGELSADAIASECMLLGSTGKLINYTKATMATNSKRGAMYDPTLELHASQIEVSSGQWISKADPTGRGILNPFVRIENGIIIKNPKIANAMLELRKKL